MQSGIILINKPSGPTSQQVVTKIKKTFNLSKVGHLGTLDPLATGLLVITVNKATKLFDYYLTKDKIYESTFVFGCETDTLDREGKITNTSCELVKEKDLLRVMNDYIGLISQMPPKYSAKSISGERAYNLVRQNIEFDLLPKDIQIYDLKLIEKIDENKYKIYIHCSSGTYVRSICRDLAYKLDNFGYCETIHRIASGEFNLEKAIPLEDINNYKIDDILISFDKIMLDKQRINFDEKQFLALRNGMTISYNAPDGKYIGKYNDSVIGIINCNNGKMKIETNLIS